MELDRSEPNRNEQKVGLRGRTGPTGSLMNWQESTRGGAS